jgi:translation initiation factor 1
LETTGPADPHPFTQPQLTFPAPASVPGMADRKVVWSSDDGDLRKAGTPRQAAERGGGRVKVRREVAGRRGKAVTTISGVPLDDAALRELAGRLKKRCGVGGSAKGGVIELQGDHRDVVVEVLRADGYDVVLAGG